MASSSPPPLELESSTHALKPFTQWLRVGLLFPLGFLNGWLLLLLVDNIQPLFNILLTSTLLAFLLDFPIRFLERRGLQRGWAVGVVLVLAVIVLTAIGIILIPILIKQLSDLISQLPSWASELESKVRELEQQWGPLQRSEFDLSRQQEAIIAQLQEALRSASGTFLSILSGTFQNTLNLFFTLVLTVFLLLGGETAWDGILKWLPPWWRTQISMHTPVKLRTFIGGQVAIAVGFGAVLALAFTVLNIPLGLLFGFIIGLGSLIPFLGAVTQISVSLFLMIQNFWAGIKVFAVAFVIGQVVDQVVSPRIMGSIVGLNPVWVLISVFIGFRLAGVLGALLAVPVASIVKTIADEVLKSRGQLEHSQAEQHLSPEPEIESDHAAAQTLTE
ncbi:MAG: AI-2E family transporter [Synechococcaceae cyanobacterium SM2_3_1]|nr:AI-2E family transporter [Synechococcaceae cyanobacterium SM2_3_1]